MLAAKKNRRQFPVYDPVFRDGKVPQKDTLLGTLEHIGPGDRGEANIFWERATKRGEDGGWHDRGSKVTRQEKLCAISLVKRFAWAQHFSKIFDINTQALRYADSATVAASKWLTAGIQLAPDDVRRKHGDWSGQWLHWSTQQPPNDDMDEEKIHDEIWNAIKTKKKTQGNPPTYFALLMFDGDKMGDRFNDAKSAHHYQRISRTLGNFTLNHIRKIVEEKYQGQLIYAGGDDALCLLPTETALACAAEINLHFRQNWDDGVKDIVMDFRPNLRKATISGGLVVAHYKEDLRFVLDQARRAEKAAKDAGRNALQITVCRRSGEHTSALIPWDFVPTMIEWVRGFLNKASDRWAYKLRSDLPVVASNPQMFELELGRQLNRTEEITQKQFPLEKVQKALNLYLELRFRMVPLNCQWQSNQTNVHSCMSCTEILENFVTLLQSASFLARGRDV
jgi:CRISPR-associated protein Cmr2